MTSLPPLELHSAALAMALASALPFFCSASAHDAVHRLLPAVSLTPSAVAALRAAALFSARRWITYSSEMYTPMADWQHSKNENLHTPLDFLLKFSPFDSSISSLGAWKSLEAWSGLCDRPEFLGTERC
ncbi:hypothetical protein ZWY2020_042244 [Hordeum vulgare]|nr:hypothetical protein ZWY2020_042244 [Hordeum vulgare]